MPEIEGEIQHYPYADRTFFVTRQSSNKVTLPTRFMAFSTLIYSEMLGVYQYTSRKSIQEIPVPGKLLPLLKENGESYLDQDYYNIMLYSDGSTRSLKFPMDNGGNIVEVYKVYWSKAGPVFQADVQNNEKITRGLYLLSNDHYQLVLQGVIWQNKYLPKWLSSGGRSFS